MKKIFALCAIMLLAASCGKQAAPSGQSNTETGDQSIQKTSGESTFKDLASGKTQKCDVTFAAKDGTQSQGTVYVANGKMRQDSTVTINGKTEQSHMIFADQTSYTWMEGQTTGFKVKMTADQNAQSGNGKNDQRGGSVNLDQKVNFNCASWTEDSGMFTPPASVTFSDFSSMMPPQAAPGKTPAPAVNSQNSNACAACDQAPAQARAQCRAALGCK